MKNITKTLSSSDNPLINIELTYYFNHLAINILPKSIYTLLIYFLIFAEKHFKSDYDLAILFILYYWAIIECWIFYPVYLSTFSH